jgi:tRNA dimethylallyltransferase
MPKKSMKTKGNTVIVILGPTATGKSALAVDIAKHVDGEVISADSRQVYTGLDIATGKITTREMLGVPHHLLDVVNPKTSRTGDFSVDEWRKLAEQKIIEILARGHVPIICGGTGFYIQSIVDNIVLPEVPPNPALRKRLDGKNLMDLVSMLKKLDPTRLKNIDAKNPVRLIRAIEIATALGSIPKLKKHKSKYNFIEIGLTTNLPELQKRIRARVTSRMKRGMIAEAEKLHKAGLSYKRMRELGLEYRYLADYLEGKLTKQQLTEHIYKSNVDYAKRQMTWFKRDKKIIWFDVT